jgi:hypothetical protein
VAKRGSRRGRSRKQRSAGRAAAEPGRGASAGERASADRTSSPGAGSAATAAPPTGAGARKAERRERRRRSEREEPAHERRGLLSEQTALGERPRAPWHPLPLSELLIFVGLVAVIIGGTRGTSGLGVVAAGVLAACIGTLDFCIREHLSGYRPHTTLLASFATALLYGLIAIVLLAVGVGAPAYFVVPLAVAVPVFVSLFRLLRVRFREARHERKLALGR